MTPVRAAAAVARHEKVIIDEGTPFERIAVLMGVNGKFVQCGDGDNRRYLRWCRVHFAPGEVTADDVALMDKWSTYYLSELS